LIESVASGVPRLDYYTSGGTAGCPALLVEPSAQNLVLNSQDTATSWAIGANTASGYIDVIGVSGNTVTASASGSIASNVFVRRLFNTVLASGSTHTVSFLMRQTGAHTIGGYWISITGIGEVGGGFNVSGSFSSGAIYSPAGAINRIRRVERWGTDVYRCSETFTLTASGTLGGIFMGPLATVSSVVATVASGTQMSFAAPQIELGALPTSFIPTTAAPVTRNAEVITLSGAVSGCIGQTEGTIYAEVDVRSLNSGVFRRVFSLHDTTINNVIQVFTSDSSSILTASISTSGVSQASIATASAVTGVAKIAIGYALNNVAFFVNGLQVGVTDTSATIPACSAINIGTSAAGGSFFNDRIRAAALYSTRLTDSELAALTTI
jgi:hypothetical protein